VQPLLCLDPAQSTVIATTRPPTLQLLTDDLYCLKTVPYQPDPRRAITATGFRSKVPNEQREQELINVQAIDWCLDDDNALAPCVRRSQRGTHISQVNSTKNAGDGPASFG
jgi:hypothetical protein